MWFTFLLEVARCESLVVFGEMLLCLGAKFLTAIVMVAQLEVNFSSKKN